MAVFFFTYTPWILFKGCQVVPFPMKSCLHLILETFFGTEIFFNCVFGYWFGSILQFSHHESRHGFPGSVFLALWLFWNYAHTFVHFPPDFMCILHICSASPMSLSFLVLLSSSLTECSCLSLLHSCFLDFIASSSWMLVLTGWL